MPALIRSRWLLIVAGIALVAIGVMTNVDRVEEQVLRLRTRIAVGQLVRSLRRDQMPVERFSALGTTGTRSSMRGSTSTDLDVQAAAGFVVAISRRSSSGEAAAAEAAAHVVNGQPHKAIEALEAALVRTPDNAILWSDLAAAHLEAAHVLRALVAADKALRIDPRSVHAQYNKALALDRIGLVPAASMAWRHCLELSSDDTTDATARERLERPDVGSETDWRPLEKDYFRAAVSGDTAEIERATIRFPRSVRAWSEMVYLKNWADAFDEAQTTEGDESLRAARSFAAALSRDGETLVGEAVDVIDAAIAHRDVDRLRRLAAGHKAYYRGRMAYDVRNYVDGEKELRAAAASFNGTGSPMERVARQWTASILIESGRVDEANQILTSLLDAERAVSGHRALVGESEYLLALCELFRGRFNEAVVAAKDSSKLFHRSGESLNAALSDNLLADILDLFGQPELGWEARMKAFRATSDTGRLDRVLVSAAGGSRAAMRAHDRDLALSMLDIEMSLAPHAHDPVVIADMLTRRVLLQNERRAVDDRDNALARARIAISSVVDDAEKARLTIELDSAEAVMVRDRNPERAVELLTDAVSFCTDTNRRLYLPEVLLNRGRAQLAAGRGDQAQRDFEAGIDELESRRGAVTDLTLRSRMLDTAEDLFEEAVSLQVRRRNAEAAFSYSERARGRELLDVVEKLPIAASADIAKRLPPDSALIEYVVLPEQLVIFSIRNGAMRMRTVTVKSDELSPDRADLYELLLKPVEDDIATAKNLIIVPDKILQHVAFNTLRRNGQALIRTHTISVAPSASLLVARQPPPPTQRSVLIIGNPAPDPDQNLEALPAVEREVEELGRVYRPARVLFGPDATRKRFIAEASNYDVIHFAGHGVSDEESLTASLLFAKSGNDSGRMYMSDIAKLRLARAPLVVLAACGTLRGKAAGVEGMPSLARSFLAAGASTVIGTLWDIDDARSAPLLASFHRHIVEGDSPAEALRSAQLEAIARGGDDADPKNWAPFVVYTATP